MKRQKIKVGTSGWHYKHWIGPFYPEETKSGDFLSHYTGYFSTAEINNTFYSLPKNSTINEWSQITPENFTFSVKASRYITHMKKLKDPEKSLPPFFEGIKGLGDKVDTVLFQLPPHWKCNAERFADFLTHLPEDYQYAFEFRDPSWINEEILEYLRKHEAAFCIYDLDGYVSPKHATSDRIYIRLHGPGNAYQGRYSKKTLAGWAGAITQWADQGKEIHCYFDNDADGYAPLNALELKEMVS